MIWIDFGIICIGQEQISQPPDWKDIVVEGYRRMADSAPFYNESYHFAAADALTGCWYQIWLPDPRCYEDSFFDIADRGVPYVQTVPGWTASVEKILRFYLAQSPVHRIAVLLRVQDRSDNVVHPLCSLDVFLQRLHDGEIRWNEVYHVHGDGIAGR